MVNNWTNKPLKNLGSGIEQAGSRLGSTAGEFITGTSLPGESNPLLNPIMQMGKGVAAGAAENLINQGADRLSNRIKNINEKGNMKNNYKGKGKPKSNNRSKNNSSRRNGSNNNGSGAFGPRFNSNHGGGGGEPSKYGYSGRTSDSSNYAPFNLGPVGDPKLGGYMKVGTPYCNKFHSQFIHTGSIHDNANYLRNTFTLINLDYDQLFCTSNSDNYNISPIDTALYKIVNQYRMAILSGTGGSKAADSVTMESMTLYFQYTQSLLAYMIALTAIINWDPPYAEQNSVFRKLQIIYSNNVELRKTMAEAQELMHQYCLPRGVIEYYRRFFTVTKISSLEGGVHHMFIPEEFISALLANDDDLTEVVNTLSTLVSDIKTNSLTGTNDFPRITTLLLDKTPFDFVSLRTAIPMPDHPIRDINQITLINNGAWSASPAVITTDNDDGILRGNYNYDSKDCQMISAVEPDEIETYEYAPLIGVFHDEHHLFPMWNYSKVITTFSNRIYLQENPNNTTYGMDVLPILFAYEDPLDFIAVTRTMHVSPTGEHTAKVYNSARGENVRLFDLTIEPVIEANVNLLNQLYDVRQV
uniref:Capsid n=1 Tax=viral metagenome TaxID=1070528 RepID=A0A2V0RC19_9ZZZZ